MIVTEMYSGQSTLKRTYSDRGMMILQEQTGIEYEEAIDLVSSEYTYAETEHPISETSYAQRYSIVREMQQFQSNMEALSETNDMLTECILEMSEIIYT